MPEVRERKYRVHIKFFPENSIQRVIERLIENGWVGRDDDPNLDGKEYSKTERNRYRSLVIMYHSPYRNYGISFKNTIENVLQLTDEQYQIRQEEERGIHRINIRRRNIENGRVALFTRYKSRMAFDADYETGNYEDNGEEVKYSIPWSFRSWEQADV